LSGRGLWDGPIPHPEECYRCVWGSVSLNVIRCNNDLYTYNEQIQEVRLKVRIIQREHNNEQKEDMTN